MTHFDKLSFYSGGITFNPIQDRERRQKGPHPQPVFSLETFTNVGISSQNFLTFSCNLFATLV